MKLSKKQLKQIIRRTINEAETIYPRPQHPMIANASADIHSQRVDSVMDELMLVMDLQDEPELVEQVAEAILARLKSDGLI